MNTKAIAFLPEMIRQALAQVQGLAQVCDDGRCPAFTQVSIADSTGFALPEELHKTLPGAGGSATKAGAKIHAVWDDTSRGLGHFALTPWNMPAQRDSDQGVTFADKHVRFIVD